LHYLENIEFNLIGEPFGYRDVIDFEGINYNFVHRTRLTITNITLQKSGIPTYKFLAVQEDNGQIDKTYMNIPDKLLKFIPKTCSDIDCEVEFVYSHKDISKEGQFFPVKFSSSSWLSPPFFSSYSRRRISPTKYTIIIRRIGIIKYLGTFNKNIHSNF